MTKVVYNCCYGGFSLSHKAILRYYELKNIPIYFKKSCCGFDYNYYKSPEMTEDSCISYIEFGHADKDRSDPVLVQVVEELGSDSWGYCAELAIKEIPKGEKYIICEYDGMESVRTINDFKWLEA